MASDFTSSTATGIPVASFAAIATFNKPSSYNSDATLSEKLYILSITVSVVSTVSLIPARLLVALATLDGTLVNNGLFNIIEDGALRHIVELCCRSS